MEWHLAELAPEFCMWLVPDRVGAMQLHVSARGWLACNAKAALLVAEQFVPMARALLACLA
jgi:hypothetical protein